MSETTRVTFFATREDIGPILAAIEEKGLVKYSQAGRLEGPLPEMWVSGRDLPNIGKASSKNSIGCTSFLILEAGANVIVDETVIFNGTKLFDVYQSSNPQSVQFTPGGEWEDGSVIAGNFASISDVQFSKALMKSVRSSVSRQFTKIRGNWVGPGALSAFKNGKRLTFAIDSPRGFDLREE